MYSSSNHQLPCEALCSRLGPNRSRQLVGYGGRDGAAYVFRFTDHTATARLEGLPSAVTALQFSANQASVVAGSASGDLCMWDVATETCTRAFPRRHRGRITDIATGVNPHYIGTVSDDGHCRLWDSRKGGCVQSYKGGQVPLCVTQFCPKGLLIATGCDEGVVRICDLRAARVRDELAVHSGAIRSISFHPESRTLAVGSDDGTASVWKLDPCEHVFRSGPVDGPVSKVQFCGSRIITASQRRLRVYSVSELSEAAAVALEAPWTNIGDMVYVQFSDEAWFVESSGTTAANGRISLGRPVSEAGESPPLDPLMYQSRDSYHDSREPNTAQLRERRPYESNRLSDSGPTTPELGCDRAALRAAVQPHHYQHQQRQAPARLQPTPPRGQRLAAKENYVVERGSAGGNDAPFIPGQGSAGMELSAGTIGAAPVPPEVPFIDETGSELDLVDQLITTSTRVDTGMHRRLTHLRVLRSMWAQDPRGAVAHLRQACADGEDAGAVHDFLAAMQQQRMKEKMPAEALPDLLDVLRCCLDASHDPLLLVAVRTLRSTYTKSRARMEDGQRRARLAQSNGYNDPLGVNSMAGCAQRFEACRPRLMTLSSRRDAIGDEARSLINELPPLSRR